MSHQPAVPHCGGTNHPVDFLHPRPAPNCNNHVKLDRWYHGKITFMGLLCWKLFWWLLYNIKIAWIAKAASHNLPGKSSLKPMVKEKYPNSEWSIWGTLLFRSRNCAKSLRKQSFMSWWKSRKIWISFLKIPESRWSLILTCLHAKVKTTHFVVWTSWISGPKLSLRRGQLYFFTEVLENFTFV